MLRAFVAYSSKQLLNVIWIKKGFIETRENKVAGIVGQRYHPCHPRYRLLSVVVEMELMDNESIYKMVLCTGHRQ